MANVYTYQDPDTGIEIDVEGDTPPTDQDLEPLFAEARRSMGAEANIPNITKTNVPPEENMVTQARNRMLELSSPQGREANPLGWRDALLGLGAAGTVAEGAIGGVGVPIARAMRQESWAPLKDIPQAFMKGVTGESGVTAGDVSRALNPDWPETMHQIVGLTSMAYGDPMALSLGVARKGALRQGSKLMKNVPEGITHILTNEPIERLKYLANRGYEPIATVGSKALTKANEIVDQVRGKLDEIHSRASKMFEKLKGAEYQAVLPFAERAELARRVVNRLRGEVDKTMKLDLQGLKGANSYQEMLSASKNKGDEFVAMMLAKPNLAIGDLIAFMRENAHLAKRNAPMSKTFYEVSDELSKNYPALGEAADWWKMHSTGEENFHFMFKPQPVEGFTGAQEIVEPMNNGLFKNVYNLEDTQASQKVLNNLADVLEAGAGVNKSGFVQQMRDISAAAGVGKFRPQLLGYGIAGLVGIEGARIIGGVNDPSARTLQGLVGLAALAASSPRAAYRMLYTARKGAPVIRTMGNLVAPAIDEAMSKQVTGRK